MFRGKMFPEARFNNGQEKAKQRNVFRVAWYKETSFNRKGSNKKKKKQTVIGAIKRSSAATTPVCGSLLASLILEFPRIRLTPNASVERDEQKKKRKME